MLVFLVNAEIADLLVCQAVASWASVAQWKSDRLTRGLPGFNYRPMQFSFFLQCIFFPLLQIQVKMYSGDIHFFILHYRSITIL